MSIMRHLAKSSNAPVKPSVAGLVLKSVGIFAHSRWHVVYSNITDCQSQIFLFAPNFLIHFEKMWCDSQLWRKLPIWQHLEHFYCYYWILLLFTFLRLNSNCGFSCNHQCLHNIINGVWLIIDTGSDTRKPGCYISSFEYLPTMVPNFRLVFPRLNYKCFRS